ncbi:histidine kinase [Halogeometricum sp. S1BR25-6]|uniref:Histidine kinase n=1 Tax=Halogeometricum salsisoli TaxID=2950536 RepID=A0ABU2G906_9EURY|nr:histidine kinase [Halogeometricum sp. S1BR25-6]MDS0297281.1 histidine kinase [Halogeometricum sp. S1BR25-6]
METIETPEMTERIAGVESWQAGVVAGLLGSIAFGAMMAVVSPGALTAAIPAMYGLSGGMAGTFIHLSHGAVLGVAFAAVLRARPDFGNTVGRATAAGAAYGVVLWVVLAVLVMPVWLSAVGFAGAPSLPNVDAMSLLGHVVYGAVLGAAYPMLRR